MTTYSYTLTLTDHTFFALKNLLEKRLGEVNEGGGYDVADNVRGQPYIEILGLMNEALKSSTHNSCSSFVGECNYSVGDSLLKDAANSNQLWHAFIDAQDYFSRLGGSGRFSGFKEWHPACIVLMTLLELNLPKNLVMSIKYQHSIPEKLWSETDDLYYLIQNRLKSAILKKNLIEEFIERVESEFAKHHDIKNMSDWNEFLLSFRSVSPFSE